MAQHHRDMGGKHKPNPVDVILNEAGWGKRSRRIRGCVSVYSALLPEWLEHFGADKLRCWPMSEGYTEKARRVTFFARYEASHLCSEYVEPEHLVLGFIREEKETWLALASDGALRIEQRLRKERRRPRKEPAPKIMDLQFSEPAQRSIVYAADEAEKHGSQRIGSIHLFLGALRERVGHSAMAPLADRGVSYESVTEILFGPMLPILKAKQSGAPKLDLSDRALLEIPENLFGLTKITELDLSGNQLKVIPEAIGNLRQMKSLDLSNNQLKSLPHALVSMTELASLDLSDNPGLELPPELVEARDSKTLRALLSYYFKTRDEQTPLNECKIILVGRGGVGKTSLVNRLVRRRFDSKEPTTEGIAIASWLLQPQQQDAVQLHVWDFGGQEIMHATHQFFLTERSLYLLVVSGRENSADADAQYWLKLISSLAGDSPVVIVLNKIDEYPFELNKGALLRKHANVRAIVATDCETDFGLDHLRKTIEAEILQTRPRPSSVPTFHGLGEDKGATGQLHQQFPHICPNTATCAVSSGNPTLANRISLRRFCIVLESL